MTDEFPAQSVSNAENVSIWWRHHGYVNQMNACENIGCFEHMCLRTWHQTSMKESVGKIWQYEYNLYAGKKTNILIIVFRYVCTTKSTPPDRFFFTRQTYPIVSKKSIPVHWFTSFKFIRQYCWCTDNNFVSIVVICWSPGSKQISMITSSNGIIFRVTVPLCGEFIGHRWIPHTKASDVEHWCFLWSE